MDRATRSGSDPPRGLLQRHLVGRTEERVARQHDRFELEARWIGLTYLRCGPIRSRSAASFCSVSRRSLSVSSSSLWVIRAPTRHPSAAPTATWYSVRSQSAAWKPLASNSTSMASTEGSVSNALPSSTTSPPMSWMPSMFSITGPETSGPPQCSAQQRMPLLDHLAPPAVKGAVDEAGRTGGAELILSLLESDRVDPVALEMEHRALLDRRPHLVHAGHDDIGPGVHAPPGQLCMERQMRSPGLVHDQGKPVA